MPPDSCSCSSAQTDNESARPAIGEAYSFAFNLGLTGTLGALAVAVTLDHFVGLALAAVWTVLAMFVFPWVYSTVASSRDQ